MGGKLISYKNRITKNLFTFDFSTHTRLPSLNSCNVVFSPVRSLDFFMTGGAIL